MSRSFEAYYSTHAIAAHFITGLDAHVAERSIEREIARRPELQRVAIRKFNQVFLPLSALQVWLGSSEPVPEFPRAKVPPVLLQPVLARSEGELHRKLAALGDAVQTLGREAGHG